MKCQPYISCGKQTYGGWSVMALRDAWDAFNGVHWVSLSSQALLGLGRHLSKVIIAIIIATLGQVFYFLIQPCNRAPNDAGGGVAMLKKKLRKLHLLLKKSQIRIIAPLIGNVSPLDRKFLTCLWPPGACGCAGIKMDPTDGVQAAPTGATVNLVFLYWPCYWFDNWKWCRAFIHIAY